MTAIETTLKNMPRQNRTLESSGVRLSFVISTTGVRIRELELLFQDVSRQSAANIEAICVLQTEDHGREREIRKLLKAVRWPPCNLIVDRGVGLSRSRNIGLRAANGEIRLLCDDDCRYPDGAASMITKAAAEHPLWDVLTFCAADEEGKPFRRYPRKDGRHSVKSIMGVCSIEIGIRSRVLACEGNVFDERFGLGRRFCTGAENVMLLDLLRKGYRIGFSRHVIVHHARESSAHGVLDPGDLAFAKGVMFRRMFGFACFFPALAFFAMRLGRKRRVRFRLRHMRRLIAGLATDI